MFFMFIGFLNFMDLGFLGQNFGMEEYYIVLGSFLLVKGGVWEILQGIFSYFSKYIIYIIDF